MSAHLIVSSQYKLNNFRLAREQGSSLPPGFSPSAVAQRWFAVRKRLQWLETW